MSEKTKAPWWIEKEENQEEEQRRLRQLDQKRKRRQQEEQKRLDPDNQTEAILRGARIRDRVIAERNEHMIGTNEERTFFNLGKRSRREKPTGYEEDILNKAFYDTIEHREGDDGEPYVYKIVAIHEVLFNFDVHLQPIRIPENGFMFYITISVDKNIVKRLYDKTDVNDEGLLKYIKIVNETDVVDLNSIQKTSIAEMNAFLQQRFGERYCISSTNISHVMTDNISLRTKVDPEFIVRIVKSVVEDYPTMNDNVFKNAAANQNGGSQTSRVKQTRKRTLAKSPFYFTPCGRSIEIVDYERAFARSAKSPKRRRAGKRAFASKRRLSNAKRRAGKRAFVA